MRRVNSNVFTLPTQCQRVLYSPSEDEFFLQCGAFYQSFGEYDLNEKDDSGSLFFAHEPGEFLTFPIDEVGQVHEEINACIHVGKPGEEICRFHEALMNKCKVEYPRLIPDIFDRARKTLKGYGIDVRNDRYHELLMSIEIKPILGNYGYYCDSGELDRYELPFSHVYKLSEYSDEALCKDIAATLEYLFQAFPAPKKLFLRVKDVETGKCNDNIANLLKEFGTFGFEIEGF